jgi:hypothetical protein
MFFWFPYGWQELKAQKAMLLAAKEAIFDGIRENVGEINP